MPLHATCRLQKVQKSTKLDLNPTVVRGQVVAREPAWSKNTDTKSKLAGWQSTIQHTTRKNVSDLAL